MGRLDLSGCPTAIFIQTNTLLTQETPVYFCCIFYKYVILSYRQVALFCRGATR